MQCQPIPGIAQKKEEKIPLISIVVPNMSALGTEK